MTATAMYPNTGEGARFRLTFDDGNGTTFVVNDEGNDFRPQDGVELLHLNIDGDDTGQTYVLPASILTPLCEHDADAPFTCDFDAEHIVRIYDSRDGLAVTLLNLCALHTDEAATDVKDVEGLLADWEPLS